MFKDFLEHPILNIIFVKTKFYEYLFNVFEFLKNYYSNKNKIKLLEYSSKEIYKYRLQKKDSYISNNNLRKTQSFIYYREEVESKPKIKSYSDSYIIMNDNNDWGWFTDIE